MLSIRTTVALGLSLFIGLTTLNCATPSTSSLSPMPAIPSPVKTPMGVGDVFELRVYREKELTGIHRVSIDGTVDIPLVGRIRVEQLSRNEVVDVLRTKLEQFIVKPQVSILVKERKSKKIFVFGQVRKPGTFEFESNMNIIQAITLAGGFDKLADQNGAFVNRIIEGHEKRIEVSVKDIGRGKATNFLLQAGDIVYIPESLF